MPPALSDLMTQRYFMIVADRVEITWLPILHPNIFPLDVIQTILDWTRVDTRIMPYVIAVKKDAEDTSSS